MPKNILGFSAAPNMQRIMECNGRYASIMRSEKKSGNDGGLPPGMPIPCLAVDYLKERPSFWVGGQGSYVCPVDSDWGLWFNWTMNNPNNTAALVSVKGMNPLTGQRMGGLGLEQYVENCPIHKTPFKHGRFCSECDLKWPDQNYVTNPLYLDGFRNADGTVRQFYFTEDMAKSVPEKVIGKDDTVPAFGFCLYGKKNYSFKGAEGNRFKDFNKVFHQRPVHYMSADTSERLSGGDGAAVLYSSDITKSAEGLRSPLLRMESFHIPSPGRSHLSFSPSRVSEEVGVGAGAEIRQSIERDEESVENWQEKPSAIFRVYFVFQEQFEQFLEAGLNDLKGSAEGFLSGVPVGVAHE